LSPYIRVGPAPNRNNPPRDWSQKKAVAVNFAPVDLDEVSRLLQQVTPPPSTEEELREKLRVQEREFYHQVVAKGLPPAYPIERFEEVTTDYQSGPAGWYTNGQVFWQQLNRWDEFVAWRDEVRENLGFSKYIETVESRLAREKFCHTFQLDADPGRQDKLSTWIEYLSFEYLMRMYDGDVEGKQQGYDRAWKKLVESGLLKPSETRDSFQSRECAIQDEKEKAAAVSAVNAARLTGDNASVERAEAALEAIKTRNALATRLCSFRRNLESAQNEASRLGARIDWILEQVPRIEAELKRSGEANSEASDGRERDDKPTGNGTAESSGVWNQALSTSSTTESASQQESRPSKRDVGYAIDSEPPLKRARGSKEPATTPTSRSRKSGPTDIGLTRVSIHDEQQATLVNPDSDESKTKRPPGRAAKDGPLRPRPRRAPAAREGLESPETPAPRRSARIAALKANKSQAEPQAQKPEARQKGRQKTEASKTAVGSPPPARPSRKAQSRRAGKGKT